MNFLRWIVLAALISGCAQADGISIAPGAPANGITIVPDKRQPRVVPVLLDGRKAWPYAPGIEHDIYFEIDNDDYKDGGHASVVITIDYYDQGIGGVFFNYDSLDADPLQGGVKKGGLIKLTGTKTWKTATFTLTDARFDDRCHDADFRLSFGPKVEFDLGSVSIVPGTLPPSIVWHQAPRGKIIRDVYDQSKIFPGTTRPYWVYIPKEYDPAKPACLFVMQDGLKKQFANAMNKLIDQKQMPVTIGLFISPGQLAPPTKQQLPRNNRSFEYDSLGDAYARFLIDEMIPFVAKTYNLNISGNPDDRCIAGGSSGGICAFNVAWERPDAFHRVYSVSGSFAAFRGGDILPELVRECEPKPLRIFLHAGTNDMVNTGGDWFLANEEMDRSLTYAGYDHQFLFDNGHHMSQYVEIFPQAMTWLWQGWPAPVKAPVGTSRIQDILLPNESWQEVGAGYQCAGGLAADPKGNVFFCDSPANKIYQVGPDGKAAPFSTDATGVNALAFGADGNLYGVAEGPGHVLSFDAQGHATVLADGIHGHDLTAVRGGGFYVTEPGAAGASASQVWHLDAKGARQLVDRGLDQATGAVISADGHQLFVADGRSHWVYAYVLNADGSLADKQRLYWLQVPDTANDSGAEGLGMDRNGLLYVATRMGVQVSGLQGHTQGYLPSPGGRITSLCFGGPDFSELYIACGDKVYQRKMKAQGEYAFLAPIVRPRGGGL